MIRMGGSRDLDELELNRAIHKAAKTEELIETHKEAWVEFEDDLTSMWKATKSDAAEKREEIYRELHAAKGVQAKMQKIVNEGRKAEEELKQQKVKHGNRSST